MIQFDIPWWAWVLIFLYLFAMYFGIGAVLGLVVARVALSLSERKDGRRPKSRSARAGLYLLAALGGGAVNFLLVSFFP